MRLLTDTRANDHVETIAAFEDLGDMHVWIGPIRVRDQDPSIARILNSSLERCPISSISGMVHQPKDVIQIWLDGLSCFIRRAVVNDHNLERNVELELEQLFLEFAQRRGDSILLIIGGDNDREPFGDLMVMKSVKRIRTLQSRGSNTHLGNPAKF